MPAAAGVYRRLKRADAGRRGFGPCGGPYSSGRTSIFRFAASRRSVQIFR
jgi:hypothetical protein